MTIFDQQLMKVAEALCSAIGSDVSRTVLAMVRGQDIKGLAALKLDPSQYDDATVFKWDYAVASLFRKLNVPGDVKRLEDEALTAWSEIERTVRATNDRFSRYLLNGPFEDLNELRCVEYLDRARGYIRRVLGRLPLVLDGRFGPGATFGDTGRLTTVPDKITSTPTITPGAKVLLPFVEETAWFRMSERPLGQPYVSEVRGCRFTTVPKDAQKRRAIAIEPSVNVYLQLAVGSYMKRRLALAGIDLIHGAERHQEMARVGSLTGCYATIDLSSASDTVAYNLVKFLLPREWFDLLDTLRSPFMLVHDRWVKVEKFSSMGNGFTFELESLIFAALAHASGAGEDPLGFSVFGDDIVVPTGYAAEVLSVLSFCGFVKNSRKTFVDGPFRESCGGDYFRGVRVTPHYLKEIPHDPKAWISLANGIRRMADEDRNGPICYNLPFVAWLRSLDPIPDSIRRLRGPSRLGDLVIHDDRGWNTKCDANGTVWIRVYSPVPERLRWHHWRPAVVLASALYGLDSTGVTPRRGGADVVSGYKVTWAPLHGVRDHEPVLRRYVRGFGLA